MSDASGTSDDLKTLQREAAELHESRQRNGSAETKKPEASPQIVAAKDPDNEVVDPEATDPPEGENQDMRDQLEMYLKELEEAALERPVLALLASFSLGVIVGQLFSRR